MLSYYYMPLKLKLCFTYCAVFPKGFTITSDHLIQQWRALGYIEPIDGKQCVHYLLGMSFLQISKTSQVSRIISLFPFVGSCNMVQCFQDAKLQDCQQFFVSTYLGTNRVAWWSYPTVITTSGSNNLIQFMLLNTLPLHYLSLLARTSKLGIRL